MREFSEELTEERVMAAPLLFSACKRRIQVEMRRPGSRHFAAAAKVRDSAMKGPSTNGYIKTALQELQGEAGCRAGLLGRGGTENKAGECHHIERVWLGLSPVGRQVLGEIRQTVRVAGKSLAAVRADVKSQGQMAWQLLAERGYLHTGEKALFPQLGRVLKAASLTCVKYQVVPRALAVAVGSNATWAHQSAGEAVPAPRGMDGQYREGVTLAAFMAALVVSLVEGLLLLLRAAYLAALFSPAILLAPFVQFLGGQGREAWLHLVHRTLELSGAAFIKWGQWAATRPDLFPRDLCTHLAKLHSAAPAHDFSQTRRTIEGAFERRLDEIFEDFEEVPVASGSIGQVHKAVLRFRHPGQKDKPVTVAVKVRHPGVTDVIRRDFAIINWVAKTSTYIPGLAWLRLDESVQQFAVFMLTQVDLAREAAHLSRFIYNFRRSKDVSFPKPLYPLVHPEVLVETFEQGKSVAHYVDRSERTPLSKGLADIGTNTLLKMLLVDNFIHADMHPGNILVRGNDGPQRGWFRPRPHVILLDVGITVELSQQDRKTLLRFFKAITNKDGRKIAEYALQFSRAQSCPDPEAFKSAVEENFKYWATEEGDNVHAGECIQAILEQVRQHKVNIDGDVCTVMVTTLVLEGWQRKLDPDLNLMGSLRTMFHQSEWARSLSQALELI